MSIITITHCRCRFICDFYPELECGGLFIWHIDHDGNETKYDCEYLKEDVERMLKHYKKHSKIHNELNRIKPIEIC